ncbi:MAG: accessory factor UbiK family protein [Alphaproteobacteria bacterium]|nr:accessory factor UbiK family protein [Alphaproteobacteria bacterium]
MQRDNRILRDLAQVANGAFSVATAARSELEQIVQHRLERFFNQRGWVTREEFDAVRDMAVRARSGHEELTRRIEELEAKCRECDAQMTDATDAAESGDGDPDGDPEGGEASGDRD